MKKRLMLVIVSVMTMMLLLASCGETTSLGVVISDDMRSASITADKATDDDFVSAGTLTIGEDEKIVIDQHLEGDGSIVVRFVPADAEALSDPDAEVEDLIKASEANYKLEAILLGEAQDTYYIPTGDYILAITAQDGKVSGTADITIEASDPFSAWNPANSAETAAAGIGLDTFVVPEGAVTSLGEVKVESYHYNDHVAMANIPIAAVQMYIMKGTDPSGDISGDFAEYANAWQQDVNGLIVTCYGNRPGEATKTIWSVNGVSYALLAYGLGGDTDYGLPATDVATLVAGIQ